VDAGSGRVRLESGDTVDYGALLIATGSVARKLDVPGADADHVFTLRSFSDCKAIIAAAESADEAIVIGASFIGMEVASSLTLRGLSVTVVAPEALPFERSLGEVAGRLILKEHESNGVSFRLGRSVSRIGPDRVVLDDGSEVAGTLVIVGVGVRPESELAKSAGLSWDDGIIVDELLRSSDERIWAAGDLARWPDPRTGHSVRVEHWVVAQRLGQAAARSMLRRAEPYRDVPFFWTHQFGVGLSYVGHAREWDSIEVEGSPSEGDGALRYMKDGQLLALATVGRDRDSLEAEAAMEASSA
jgi:3-phenylpropionate/trans-cinnamate dioxygenase ferredoxin reductase subunit